MFTNFSADVRQTLVTDRQRSLTAATGRVGSARGEKGSLQVILALALAMVLALLVATKAEASAGTTQVSGLLTPDGAARCPGGSTAVGAYVASGSLTGCWYVDSMTVDHLNDNGGGFIATGREHFIGCLGSRCGQLRTTYTFTAKFAPDGSEIHGRCHHPVIGGDGGFAGVTGAFEMHDLPNGCAAYHGTLKF